MRNEPGSRCAGAPAAVVGAACGSGRLAGPGIAAPGLSRSAQTRGHCISRGPARRHHRADDDRAGGARASEGRSEGGARDGRRTERDKRARRGEERRSHPSCGLGRDTSTKPPHRRRRFRSVEPGGPVTFGANLPLATRSSRVRSTPPGPRTAEETRSAQIAVVRHSKRDGHAWSISSTGRSPAAFRHRRRSTSAAARRKPPTRTRARSVCRVGRDARDGRRPRTSGPPHRVSSRVLVRQRACC